VFAGDKYGNIALWDATTAGQTLEPTEPTSIRGVKKEAKEVKDEDDGEEAVEDEEEEAGEDGPSNGKFWLWKAHNKNSVSCLKFRPHETKKVSTFRIVQLCVIGIRH
jgi:hypothetical protein